MIKINTSSSSATCEKKKKKISFYDKNFSKKKYKIIKKII